MWREPLTDGERADKEIARGLSDQQRIDIRHNRIAAIEEYAVGTLRLLKKQDRRRRHQDDNGYMRGDRGMLTEHLVSVSEARTQTAFLLEELERLGLPVPRRLLRLKSYLHLRGPSAKRDKVPKDDDPRFIAVVSYSIDHEGASDLAIATAVTAAGTSAGIRVTDKTVAEWRKLPDWGWVESDLRAERAYWEAVRSKKYRETD